MKFSPTEPELVKATEISVLSDDASNLREPNLYIWGSKWDEKHLQALRVLIFNDLSVSRLLPQRWLPHHNLKGKFYVTKIVI